MSDTVDSATPCNHRVYFNFVCITYTADTVYIASGREIGSLDVLHQAVNIDFVIVNVSYTGIYYFWMVAESAYW